ncbi:endonuclease MutS2 [Fenollaria sp.]|uniref:endonuclease MutS2 n=1 Tax=Fenollaria sp. TaxID=1965292 RepID=UPI002A74E213|nr:endonuclease MutS2 [Fenollaria sp.]MDY3106102.1 endonuclease MutS2 [Fenollaria sp.]
MDKALKVLEYDKIIDMLLDLTQGELARDLVKKLEPSNDIDDIRRMQEETSEAYRVLVRYGDIDYSSATHIKHLVSKASLGSMLFIEDLYDIMQNIFLVSSIKRYLKTSIEDENLKLKHLRRLNDSLASLDDLKKKLSTTIVSRDEIADNASSTLRSIRRSKKLKNQAIEDKLNSYITSDKTKKYLQDAIVTMREGRYVIPVKNEYRSSVEGMIHDISQKGSTVFIEPMAVVKLNNELRELENEEKKEIERILYELSSEVSEYKAYLETNEEALKSISFIFARARLAREMRATEPILNDKGYVNLKNARHPLIPKDKVVPTTVELGDEYTSLIITGPNTGGKTVSLKTVGLITLMAKSGLNIPCDNNSSVAVFDKVYADIGDEQSIEQSLSTFSSHMKNIVHIVENAEYNDLVLFDELGAGTDPTEGAALAISILKLFRERRIRTMATTHYSQIKFYALTSEGVKNASMEFNVDTLSPTYRLIIGIPGKSNAFEISKRLGLDQKIIDSAKKLLNENDTRFEDVLKAIEEDRTEIENKRIKINEENEEIERLREKLENKNKKLEEKQEAIINKAKEEAREIVKKAKSESAFIIDELKDISSLSKKEDRRRLQEAKDYLRDLEDENRLKIKDNKKRTKEIPKDIKLGESVRIISIDKFGEVETLPDDKGDLNIQVGIMSVRSNINDIERSESKEEVKVEKKTKSINKAKSKNISSEINLIGRTVDEAILLLDKYLDDAYLARLKEVRIIHGKGTGTLRDAVRKYLQNSKHVIEYREADYTEGGSGATVAVIK